MSSFTTQADILTQSLYYERSHNHVSTSTSTNSELIESILTNKLNTKSTHLLTASKQIAGRGQNGRSWQSPTGNVYLSLYYPKQHPLFPMNQPISGLLSLCVGYYITQIPVIQNINISRRQTNKPIIGMKWANDIGYYSPIIDHYTGKQKFQFQKLAGILIEPVIQQGKMLGIVVGIGLNVSVAPNLNNETQESMCYQSICIQDLLNRQNYFKEEHSSNNTLVNTIQVSNLYRPITHSIFQAILTHQQISKNNADIDTFMNKFKGLDILRNRLITVSQLQNVISGRGHGIDRFGCLQLKSDDGKVCSLFAGKIDVVK